MASLAYDERALDDLIRLADFLAKEGPASALAAIDLIEEAVGVLASHPLIGGQVLGELRQLVISRGRTGYLALYEYQPAFDRVIVRAIRHQRETGYEE